MLFAGGIHTNKLNYIRDRVFGSTSHTNTYGATTDVKDQAANNYTYDAIGNLKSSVWRGPSNINWNVYGKIEELTKPATSGTTAQLIHYYYDPSGNRTGQAMRMGASGANFNYIWYVKDAQGNTLATYTVTDAGSASAGTLLLDEHYIYGSDRVGTVKYTNFSVDRLQRAVTGYSANLDDSTYLYTFTRGNKIFELTNHLGNVSATTSDRRTPIAGAGGLVSGYSAVVNSLTDYSPFGMALNGRVSNIAGNYRYGFNGQEMDHQIYGNGNAYSAEFWEYDPRVGRRWNQDPIKFAGLSPFSVFDNNPISNVDPNGALFWGLFGSSSEQRASAKSFARETGGKVANKWRRDIHVNYASSTEGDNSSGTILTAQAAYFLDDGRSVSKAYKDWYNNGGEGTGLGRTMDYLSNSKDWIQTRLETQHGIYKDGFGTTHMVNPNVQGLERPLIDPVDILAGGIGGLLGAATRTSVSTTVGKTLAGFGSDEIVLESMANLAAKGGSKYLYHYTSEAAAQSISKTGLRTGKDGFLYLTNKSGLSPLQAQIELALPANRALPTSILRIDASGLSPSIIRRVQGNLPGMGAGGGTEFLFNQNIPANLIKIVK